MRNCLILVIVIITTFSICYSKQFDEAVKDAAKNDNISPIRAIVLVFSLHVEIEI